MNHVKTLDRFDRKILEALTRDGRMSWRDLSDEIGLSLTPTLRRVRRLEDCGIISGYTARLDQRKLLGGMTAFISVTLERQVEDVLSGFEKKTSRLPEIMGAFLMTGGADYLLHAIVRDLEHYQALLTELTRTPGVAHIQSSFALKTYVLRQAPLLDDHAQ
jgi:Lrp/AsnC family transcriptional regulator, leucine-responsive regulatory protein